MNEKEKNELVSIAQLLKRNVLQTIQTAQTGHLGACCSSLELMTALYFTNILRIDQEQPKHPLRDYVLCRGHLGPLRYNIFALLGWMEQKEMTQYRKYGSRLCGHEDMFVTPGVDITPSGSLGMLLSYAVGARTSFRERGMDNRLFCFLGDGEEQEGNISEAARHATNIAIENLIVVIDKNAKQLSTAVKYTDAGTNLAKIWEGYGWNVMTIDDGHDLNSIYECYKAALDLAISTRVCIIANTIKGNGIAGAEQHYCGYHVFHSAEEDQTTNIIPIKEAIETIITPKKVSLPKKVIHTPNPQQRTFRLLPHISYDAAKQGMSYDYLEEFLLSLAHKKEDQPIYILSADYPPRSLVYETGNFSIPEFPYFNVGIREQHALAMAHGICTTEPDALVLILCGDAFMYRCADQMNVLAQSHDRVILYAVQAGISGAKNGSTHQSSGQPGIALTMPGMNFFEPTSKRDWFYVINNVINHAGPSYIRTHKGKTAVDYGGEGNFYAIKIQQQAACTIATCGQILPEAVKAMHILAKEGIYARIINTVNPKQLTNVSKLIQPNKPLFCLYNGNPEVLSHPISKDILATKHTPSILIEKGFEYGLTGSISDLLCHFELDAKGIMQTVKKYT